MVIIWSAPETDNMLATSFAVMEARLCRGICILSEMILEITQYDETTHVQDKAPGNWLTQECVCADNKAWKPLSPPTCPFCLVLRMGNMGWQLSLVRQRQSYKRWSWSGAPWSCCWSHHNRFGQCRHLLLWRSRQTPHCKGDNSAIASKHSKRATFCPLWKPWQSSCKGVGDLHMYSMSDICDGLWENIHMQEL